MFQQQPPVPQQQGMRQPGMGMTGQWQQPQPQQQGMVQGGGMPGNMQQRPMLPQQGGQRQTMQSLQQLIQVPDTDIIEQYLLDLS